MNTAPEEKWWYRLLKVAYILLYIGSLLAIFGISYSSFPERIVNNETSTINCNNGKVYPLGKNDLYAISDSLNHYNDKDARILCEYDTLNYYNSYYSNLYIAPNYTFMPRYIEPDYNSWIIGVVVLLLGTLIFLKLLRIGAMYIAFGHKPRWIHEFKKIY